jgi:hypothetical protein
MKRLFIILAVFVFAGGMQAEAQVLNPAYEPGNERASFELRRQSIMDGNRTRATYHNYLHAGREGGDQIDQLLFEYPINTNREYIYFISFHMGTEVQDLTDSSVTFPIVNAATFKTNRTGDQNWSINPIFGYARDDTDEIARSDRGPNSPIGNTWPNVWPNRLVDGGDGWAGSWNGFFGRDQFNADVEFYYRSGDDLYTRFSNTGRWYPDPNDLSRGGLGMIFDSRILAWSQTLVNSAHFNIFEITNDSQFDYEQVAFGIWIADFVASNGNDAPEFDDLLSIAYLKEQQREPSPPQFDGLPIGEMGIQLLETPGNQFDGIDNDGDSDAYNPTSVIRYDPDNVDLYTIFSDPVDGFYPRNTLQDSLVPLFTAADLQERVILPGDKIVLIQDDNSRVVAEYPAGGGTVVTQGRSVNLPASGLTIREDLLPETDPDFGVHIDGFDNDFDGLIDESTPNHLEKNVILPNGNSLSVPVRFINYLYYEVGDTLQSGLIVPNQTIRQRIASDPTFADLVAQNEGRFINVFTAAPMIDEGRDDFFDNDQDWLAVSDDVGIEGDPDTPSDGQGDGLPTSGAGTPFPGEPAIDKTDVSETDLIGVTRASIFDAGALQVIQDPIIWQDYLVPGEFSRLVGNDSDIYVSSGLFPMRAGQTQRYAFAVAASAAETQPTTAAEDRAELNRRLDQAREAYEADYQFAVAPTPPIVTAVEGDGEITIYWDTSSEQSFDRFVDRITGDGNDFQGYRVYRSTDPSFSDRFTITNSRGTPQFYRPNAIFDIVDGISGDSEVDVNGVKYDLGSDSGLEYSYRDTTVINGVRYYYAVTAFDAGIDFAGIAPSESPIQISRLPSGQTILGQNVVLARGASRQAGYISPEEPLATQVTGSASGTISVDVVDPEALRQDNRYAITFQDTLISSGTSAPDTLRTKNFTLRNITDGRNDTLIGESPNFDGQINPITEGFTLRLENEDRLSIDLERSQWIFSTNDEPHRFDFNVWVDGLPKASDYRVIVGDNVGFGQSIERFIPQAGAVLPSVPTNFIIINESTGDTVDYVFADLHTTGVQPGELSASNTLAGLNTDIAILVEDVRAFQDTLSYRLQMNPVRDGGTRNPTAGDELSIRTTKPFTINDSFEFIINRENLGYVDTDSARASNALDDILVIPNPYRVTSIFEQANANVNDRSRQRELHFTNLPVPSTLRIFTISGRLVDEIKLDRGSFGGASSGTYSWNLLTKENLELSYGVYLYHVDAPGIGQKTGKFAVIK